MRYATIVADPPWRYPGPLPADIGGKHRGRIGRRSVALPYPSLSADEISALPVADFAAPDCRLFLWVTNLGTGRGRGLTPRQTSARVDCGRRPKEAA